MSGTSIETYTGRMVDYRNVTAKDIDVLDIAHALSNICRFGGHTRMFYSVAEHCLIVRELVRRAGREDLGLAALLHDAHEAYVGDIPTPLKGLLAGLAPIADAIDVAVAKRWHFPECLFRHPTVKQADTAAMLAEGHDGAGSASYWAERGKPLDFWVPEYLSPPVAFARFLDVYSEEMVARG